MSTDVVNDPGMGGPAYQKSARGGDMKSGWLAHTRRMRRQKGKSHPAGNREVTIKAGKFYW